MNEPIIDANLRLRQGVFRFQREPINYIAQADTSGGWGANYLVRWKAETQVT